jgi:hypothetical protein
MMAGIIDFATLNPFIVGVAAGGGLFGGALGIIGWCLGYEAAMRKVGGWMRSKQKPDEAHGDVPELPPVRERRFIPTVGRS